MDCDFFQIADGQWKCRRCGRVVGGPRPPNPQRLPPCGWKPLIVESHNHIWVEQAAQAREKRLFRCQRCFQEVQFAQTISAEEATVQLEAQSFCPAPSWPTPNLFRQGVRYAEAVANWLASGRPVRPPAEIERILEICKTCDRYEPAAHRCRLCGCRVNAEESGWINKIAMATEACPLGKW